MSTASCSPRSPAPTQQVLGVPRGDLRRSNERVPSRWVLEVASWLAGDRWWTEDLLAATVPWVEHVASFDGRRAGAGLSGHRAGAPPAVTAGVPAARRHRRWRAWPTTPPWPAAHSWSPDAAAPGSRASTATWRGSHVPSPVDGVTSATRLERWAVCPFAYFVESVLGVAAVENPEDALQIRPIDRGNARPRRTRAVRARGARPGQRPSGPVPTTSGRQRTGPTWPRSPASADATSRRPA